MIIWIVGKNNNPNTKTNLTKEDYIGNQDDPIRIILRVCITNDKEEKNITRAAITNDNCDLRLSRGLKHHNIWRWSLQVTIFRSIVSYCNPKTLLIAVNYVWIHQQPKIICWAMWWISFNITLFKGWIKPPPFYGYKLDLPLHLQHLYILCTWMYLKNTTLITIPTTYLFQGPQTTWQMTSLYALIFMTPILLSM